MGLSWQQGPLSLGAIGRFLVPESLPQRLLYIEPLRRRMRVRFAGAWIADSEHVLLLFEPGRYPVAYFPQTDISPEILERTEHTTRHQDLGLTAWYSAKAAEQHATRAAWEHVELPSYAGELRGRKHEDVEGCDYKLVDAAAASSKATAFTQSSPSTASGVANAMTQKEAMRARFAHWHHQPSFGPNI